MFLRVGEDWNVRIATRELDSKKRRKGPILTWILTDSLGWNMLDLFIVQLGCGPELAVGLGSH